MNGSGLVCLERHPLGNLATSQRYCSLTRHEVSVRWTVVSPSLVGPEMDHSASNLEKKEGSAVWASSKGNCLEAPCGAAKQDPAEQGAGRTSLIGEERPPPVEKTSENLEGLTEKVGILGLQITKNRCGAARNQARMARLVEAGSGQPQSTRKDRPRTQPKHGTSGSLHAKRPAPIKLTPSEDGRPSQGPSKRQ
jgi:hypothetical protein